MISLEGIFRSKLSKYLGLAPFSLSVSNDPMYSEHSEEGQQEVVQEVNDRWFRSLPRSSSGHHQEIKELLQSIIFDLGLTYSVQVVDCRDRSVLDRVLRLYSHRDTLSTIITRAWFDTQIFENTLMVRREAKRIRETYERIIDSLSDELTEIIRNQHVPLWKKDRIYLGSYMPDYRHPNPQFSFSQLWTIELYLSIADHSVESDAKELFSKVLHPTTRTLFKNFDRIRRNFSLGMLWMVSDDTTLYAILAPEYSLNSAMQLHASTGPAVYWQDGSTSYFYEGIAVSRGTIEEPTSLTLEDIFNESNVERRRIMIQQCGVYHLLKDADSRLVHHDHFDGDERKLFSFTFKGEEEWRVLQVTCPSTRRYYHLIVPPEIEDCHSAVAWTFGFDKGQYAPLKQT